MTALHPSIDVRYKDGHAAKAALEQAWERCINEELVGPKAFSGREVPHAKAPKLMHGGGTGTSPHAAPAPESIHLDPTALGGGTGDDDPTQIMVTRTPQEMARLRGEDVDPNDAIMEAAKKAASGQDHDQIEAAAKMAAGLASDAATDHLVGEAPKAGLWAAVLFAALVTGGLLAYYVINVL